MTKTTKPTITTFKGFDPGFSCRGYQFEFGKTHKITGRVQACERGFHACENPWDVLRYYPLLNDDAQPNAFAIVEQGGELSRHSGDTKVASAEITIKTELKIPAFIGRLVDWLIADATPPAGQTTVDGGQVSSGESSNLAASGNYSNLAASGNYSNLAASGNYSKLAASGESSKLAASGESSNLAASGESSNLAASGRNSVLAASGRNSVLAASGPFSRVKGAKGTWLAVAEFSDDGKRCLGFATGCVGADGIKPDVWYVAKGGKLVEL